MKFVKHVIEQINNMLKTNKLKTIRLQESGIFKEKRKPLIVVSLTSYPGRIDVVHKTITTLLHQSLKPDVVILWLAYEQFRNKSLPIDLINLKKYGLEIKWCDDIRSYKKLIPALELFPDDIIVTADDDNYYENDWLEKLYNSYIKHPDCISVHKATKFVYSEDGWNWIAGGREYHKAPSFANKLVGVGGVLYPPHSLYKDICNRDLFIKLSPTNDDQWFWFMAVLNGTKICVVDDPIIHSKPVEGTLKDGLWRVNDQGDKLFSKQFAALLSYYPEFETKIIEEKNSTYND